VDNGIQQRSPLSLNDLWIRVNHRRWIVLAFVLLGWTIGTGLGWFLPARYRSETVILIEQQKVPEHYVEPNVSADLQQRLQNISQRILSRTRLLRLIDKFDLYNAHAVHADPDALVEKMRRDIGIELMKGEGRREELSAFKVSYSAGSPQLAKDVTSELTSFFIDEDLRNREQLSENTTTFLSSQLDDARKSLAEQEEKLRQFRGKYLGELPEQMQGNLQILGGLQSQLQAATDALTQAEQRNLSLRSQLNQSQAASHGSNGTVKADGSTPAQRLASLQAQLRELNGRYTAMHPDILVLKQEIAHLEAQQTPGVQDGKDRIAATENSSGERNADGSNNSVSAQLSTELSANAFEIANQKAKIKRLEEEIERYQGRLNLTPVLEQQAAAVTRDYEQSRTYYDSLLAKKLQSEMATNLEKRREGEQFIMIDPPQLPQRPFSPNRLGLALGGLGVGLLLGLAIVALLEIAVRPRIYLERELSELARSAFTLSIPPLATAVELRRKSKMRVLEAVAAGVFCVIVPAITLLTYYKS
jgi:succinoglycan biosynthesis transport protein ExoP